VFISWVYFGLGDKHSTAIIKLYHSRSLRKHNDAVIENRPEKSTVGNLATLLLIHLLVVLPHVRTPTTPQYEVTQIDASGERDRP